MKLDRSRPFGEVFGDGKHGRYEQDGVMFDEAGDPISKRAPARIERSLDLVDQAGDPAPVVRKVRGGRKVPA